MGGPVDKPKSETSKIRRPKGWNKMNVFVDRDGNVFHQGEEQVALKGSLPSTEVIKKSKFQRGQEKEAREQRKIERYNKQKEKALAKQNGNRQAKAQETTAEEAIVS